jgi:predicted permease
MGAEPGGGREAEPIAVFLKGDSGVSIVSWLDGIAQDIRYGVRLLLADRAFTFVAISSLALGIGANTAIFQLLDAVRLRSLPIKEPRELAEIKIVGGNHGMGIIDGTYGELTRPIWDEIRRDHLAFSGVFAWSEEQFPTGEGAGAQLTNGILVSGDFFRVLGVEPWRGRLIQPADEHSCPESTAVVGYEYWQTKMGGREIGPDTKLFINGGLKQITGVTPPSFFGLSPGKRFDIALPFCRPRELRRDVYDVSVMGRLHPGWTLPGASAQLAAQSPSIMAATEISGYDLSTIQSYRKFRLGAFSASSGISSLREAYASPLWLLLAITGMVLLTACANLTNLMLARASTREREIAVRLAVGASRMRLLRQMSIESGLLATAGAALGLGLAQGLSRLLVVSLSTTSDTVNLPMEIDWRVCLFTGTVAALTCIAFGIAPALRASGADPVAAMKAGGRGMTASREHFSMQRVMVVAQISISLALVTGALLFVGSFYNLMTLDPGLREQGIIVAHIGFQNSDIPRERIEELRLRLLGDIRSVPGVIGAATTTMVPLLGGAWAHSVSAGLAEGLSMFTWVSPEYFETMGISLLDGRGFNQSDTAGSERVAVVNQGFVHSFLNGVSPLGSALRTHPEPGYPATVYKIVGTIADTKYDSLRAGTPPMAFAPASQFPAKAPWTAIMIHSRQPPSMLINSLRKDIATRHPEVTAQFTVFQTQIREGLVRERLMAMVSGFFGVLAALLGMVGIYGVISYMVTRRRNEIGIRAALGASRMQVISMVMREAAILLLIGAVIGAILSLAAAAGARSLLFGIKPHDPRTLAISIGLLVSAGAVASFLPAYRASKADPMAALRCE